MAEKKKTTKEQVKAAATPHVRHHHTPQERHPRTGRHWHLLMPIIAGFLGLVIGGGMLLAVAGAVQSQRNAAPSKAVAPLVFGPQAQVTTNMYQANLVGDIKVVQNEPAFKPAEGNEIIILKMSLTNTTNSLQHFLPSFHTYIRDEEGQTFELHPTLSVTDPLPAADLNPGESVSGELSYEIPKNLKNFRFYVDPYWDRMAPVVFRLSR